MFALLDCFRLSAGQLTKSLEACNKPHIAGHFSTRMWEDLSAAGMLKEGWSTGDINEAGAVKDITDKKKEEIQKPKRDMRAVADRVRPKL